MFSSEKKNFETLKTVLPAFAAIILLNAAVFSHFHLPFPDPSSMQIAASEAVQTSGLLGLGMRRLAADLSFIQLLMYYGTEEPYLPALPSGTPHIEAYTFGVGFYPELKERALRIIRLDPYFTYNALYASGALAFNLDRPDEALQILEEASKYDPQNWKLKAYIAAIGFSKKGDALSVIDKLTPVLLEPDCPAMLKNLLAFLNRRAGHKAEAIRIYKDLLQSRDHSYDHFARQALHELGAQ